MGLNRVERKLLDKFNISISCLDYSYIRSATNVTEVENILKILRSGEEGFYPDLIKFCENRLNEISPGNKLLQVPEKVSCISDLPSKDQALLQNNIKDWVESIKVQDKELVNAPKKKKKSMYPPIRNASEQKHKEEQEKMKEKKDNVKDSFRSESNVLNYGEWDKLDVNEEMQSIDAAEDSLRKRLQSFTQTMKDNKDVLPFVDVTGLSETEKKSVADMEKTKGNECFKSQEYIESLLYYSRSISAHPTAVAYNNRAMAYIKLKNYEAAIADCEEALHIESDNVKAFYRRGLAYKETGRMQLAYMDFQNALDLDPTCTAAKEKLKTVDNCPVLKTSKNVSPTIEEIKDSDLHQPIKTSCKENTKSDQDPQCLNSISSDGKQLESESSDVPKLSPSTIEFLKGCEKKRKIVGQNTSPLKAKTTKYIEKEKYECKSSLEETEIIKADSSCNGNEGEHLNNKEHLSVQSTMSHSISEISQESGNAKEREEIPKDINISAQHFNDAIEDLETSKSNKIIKVPSSTDEKLCPNSILKGKIETFVPFQEEMTPFKFLNLWHTMNANKDSQAGVEILSKILPQKLPSYITNKLDADLLNGIVKATKNIVQSGDWVKGCEIMKHLRNIPRINIITSFLSTDEKKDIGNLLCLIDENQKKEISELRKTFLGNS